MNLYEILNVEPFATKAQIKKAYKKLASIHHPDKNGDAERMADINLAWEVLQDDDKRERYDLTGETGNQPAMLDKVIDHLTQRLCALMDQHNYAQTDYFKMMMDELNNNVRSCDQLKVKLAGQITKFKRLISQMTVKNESLIDGLNAKLDVMKAQVEQLKNQDEAFDLTRQVLEECEYTGEIPAAVGWQGIGNRYEVRS